MLLLLLLLILLGLLLLLLVQQIIELLQFDVVGVQLEAVGGELFGLGDVVGNIELRAAMKVVIGGLREDGGRGEREQQQYRGGLHKGITVAVVAAGWQSHQYPSVF